MDEILIGEKKYVSSKQAAKVTGYAKDYIGQLCREGRVPARLVGRSWYVLETAIQDHRFGDQKIGQQDAQPTSTTPVFPSTWESPRYESSPAEILPSVNRLREGDVEETMKDDVQEDPPQSLQDSWRSWFDHAQDSEPVAVSIRHMDDDSDDVQPPIIDNNEEPEAGKTDEVNIPIHTVYELPSEVVIPRHIAGTQSGKEISVGRAMVKTIKTTGAVLAVFAVALAAIGTGYFDKYILSNSQVNMIAGVSMYNK